jgi:hypothetical protein
MRIIDSLYLTEIPSVLVENLYVNDVQQTDADEAVTLLNSFIGSFRSGGSSSSTPQFIKKSYSVELGAAGQYDVQVQSAPDGYVFAFQYAEMQNDTEAIPVPTVSLMNLTEQTACWFTTSNNMYHVQTGIDRTGYVLTIVEFYIKSE